MTIPARTYEVKLVRGPFVRLRPHPEACDDEHALHGYVRRIRREDPDALLAADLFAGAGGLSLGLEQAGLPVVLAVDRDPEAVETHRHHFGGLAVDWDLSTAENIERVARLVTDCGIRVLAGGPPCQPFSKAGRSLVRHLVRHGLRNPHEEQRDLWQSFVEVVGLAKPDAVVMENVPDMALDREMLIFRVMTHALEALGYSVEERLVDTWRYGVPQFRQRLILVALKDGLQFDWPQETEEKVTVWNAIGDLPEVAGGWRPPGGGDGWIDYPGPRTSFQRNMRHGVGRADADKAFDHITRPVRADDERAFELMDSHTRYSQLPDQVKRYRDDIFEDKYKRLDENGLSRTITAHIAKDGYWYIHPRQNRTLTIREAARLQTFPDWFRFAGPPSAAFRQIGNAVPPRLGRQLGIALRSALRRRRPALTSSRGLAATLAGWIDAQTANAVPWIAAETRWQVLSGELLLDRSPTEQVRYIWPLLARWLSPAHTVAGATELREMARWINRSKRAEQLLQAATWFLDHTDAMTRRDAMTKAPHITEAAADLACLAVPTTPVDEAEEPILTTKGVLRVTARFTGEAVDRQNRLSNGRMSVARMIGASTDSRRAHLSLIEIAARLCTPTAPRCPACPLRVECWAAARQAGSRSPAVR